jgi:hypothetical protein
MIIKSDRSALDARLADPDAILLLLRDPENNSPGQAVHDFFVANAGVWDPWHYCFLITDECPLTGQERADWFDDQNRDRYAVLCLPDANGHRARAAHGQTSTKLYVNGLPDIFRILDALQSCP